MLFDDKTQNNIMIDLIESVSGDISKEEGTLIDHAFRGAALSLRHDPEVRAGG